MIRFRFSFAALIPLVLLLTAELAAQEAGTGPSLEEQYFERDLEQSELDELRIWCRSLFLDDEGTEAELKERLRSYYSYGGLSPDDGASADGKDKSKADKQSTQLEIRIESADSTEYYQIEDKGEEIHLTGKVHIAVTDNREDRAYTITADRIVFSRLDDSLTALGNVEYSRAEGGGESEHFLGQSMTFHIEGWQGVIYDGVSSRIDQVDGKDIEFYFTGEQIDSSGFDLAVMEKGTITSGKWDDPEYSIKAGKIWLTGPEEWGLVNGVLYLGRIPLLYLPFYYKPGNDLFYNPSIGFRTREGTTIQTTTYLYGQKSPENTSFFSAGLNSDATYELERKGFFLYKGDKTEEADEGYLKFMADYYSRLGAFAGVEGQISPGETAQPIDMFAGIGVSRSIDGNNNIYFEDDDFQPRWNTSNIGPLELPFRWGAEISYGAGNFSLDLKYYSDPSFMGDFSVNRVENFDPLNFVLSDLGEDTTETGSTVSSFSWLISWRKNFATEALSPWLEGINVTRFNTSLEWSSIIDSEYSDIYSPTRKFFYPENLTLPDTAVKLSGTLWNSDASEAEETADAADTEKWLFPETGEKGGEGPLNKGDTSYINPEIRDSRSISEGEAFSGSLKWSSTTTALMLNEMDNFTDVTVGTPSEISFLLDKGKFSLSNKDSLTLNFDFFDERINFTNSHSFSINARQYLSLTGEDADLSNSELKDQYSYDSIKWKNSSSIKGSPFSLYSLKSSYVKYTMGIDLFEKNYQTMDGSSPVFKELWLSGNEDGISQSELEAVLSFKPVSYFNTASTYKTSLYTDGRDVDSSLKNSLSLTTGPLSSNLNQTMKKSGDEDWEPEPVRYKGVLDLDPIDITLSEQFSYDVDNSRIESNTLALSGYGLSASLDADYTYGYEWITKAGVNQYQWIKGTEALRFSSASASYALDWDMPPLWKSRLNGDVIVKTGWKQNLIKFNDSVLNFTLGMNFSIHQFMDLSLSMVSSNKNMYLYIPYYRDKLGIKQEYNFFEDLVKSMNFFTPDDRLDSFFNLSSLELNLTHYLGNWNFILNYSGSPSLVDKVYMWQSVFSFYLQWDPVPTLNMDVLKDSNDNWDIKAGETE